MTKYERLVIKPIFDVIEKHQKYLTQPENLPQLAKIGYIYNKMYYAGRVAYGYDGIVKKGNCCENNPKDWLENVNYLNEKIDYLVYDAWGMHESGNTLNFDDIKSLVFDGKPLSDFEIKRRKPNKTFDQWVEILTDKQYKYHSIYPNKKRVADYLLCVIGTGYGYNKKTGCIIAEASGADQDIDLYGDWENSILCPEIKPIIEKIFEYPEVKIALDAESDYVKAYQKKKKDEDFLIWEDYYNAINEERLENGLPQLDKYDPDTLGIIYAYLDEKLKAVLNEFEKNEENEEIENEEFYKPSLYYPISNYSIITQFDKNTHISYINAGIEICEDILLHKEDYLIKNEVNYKGNVTFAEKFLRKFKNEKS